MKKTRIVANSTEILNVCPTIAMIITGMAIIKASSGLKILKYAFIVIHFTYHPSLNQP